MEHQRLRTAMISNPNKRQREEHITTLNVDDGNRSQVCIRFQNGRCTRGTDCKYAHTTNPTVKRVQFAISDKSGKGKGKGKPVHEVNIPFKGSKGSKGQKGKGKGKGNHKGDGKGKGTRESQPVHCNRCESSHHGATGKMCVMPPCRYCQFKKLRSLNHHLKDCRNKPSDWEFQPNTGSPGKRPPPTPKDNPSPAKVAKVSADAWLKTATVRDFNKMREMAHMIGEELDASKGITASSEPVDQVTAIVKYTAAPKPTATAKATETTHIVPIQPTARIGTVTRTPNKTPDGELLQMARAKAAARFGGKQQQDSIIMSDATEDAPFSWNGLHSVSTIDLNFDDDLMRAVAPQR